MDAQSVLPGLAHRPGSIEVLPYGSARAVFDAMFARTAGDVVLPDGLCGLRVGLEWRDALQAAVDSAQALVQCIEVDASRPVVILPHYPQTLDAVDGVPLLACLLADAGIQVVVHGEVETAPAASAARVMRAMGLAPVARLPAASTAIQRGDPAFVPIDLLLPPLARMLRSETASEVRGAALWVAGLLNPTRGGRSLRVVAAGDVASAAVQRSHLLIRGAEALLMNGLLDDGVAPLRALARIEWVCAGRCQVLAPKAWGTAGDGPALPDPLDAPAMARWIQSVLAGERPVPIPIGQQLSAILDVLDKPAADGLPSSV